MIGFVVFAVLLAAFIGIGQGVLQLVASRKRPRRGRHRPANTPPRGLALPHGWTWQYRYPTRWWHRRYWLRRRRPRPPRERGVL